MSAATCWKCGWHPEAADAQRIVQAAFCCPKCSAAWGRPEPAPSPAPSEPAIDDVLELARAIDAVVFPASAYQTEAGRHGRVDAVLKLLDRFDVRLKD